MGRKKIYLTEEQQAQALRERQMRYYQRNRDDINNKNKERYHDNKLIKDNSKDNSSSPSPIASGSFTLSPL